MKNLLRKMRYLIGNKRLLYPIYSNEFTVTNMKSNAGGSLKGKNVLIISNHIEDLRCLRRYFDLEECLVCIVYLGYKDKVFSKDNDYHYLIPENIILNNHLIEKLSVELAGPFDIIINSLLLEPEQLFFNADGVENRFDGLKLLYQLSQIESEYLITHKIVGHLLNICQYNDTIQERLICAGMKSMVNGLGKALGEHRIISNGVAAKKGVPIEDLGKIAVYSVSRYGEVLAGEVLNLMPRTILNEENDGKQD